MPPNIRSIHDLPPLVTELHDCPSPPSRPPSTTNPTFAIGTDDQSSLDLSLLVVPWTYYSKAALSNCDRSTQELNLPPRSAHQSMVSSAVPITIVGAPPLITSPSHEGLPLPTVFKQAQDIKTAVVGP